MKHRELYEIFILPNVPGISGILGSIVNSTTFHNLLKRLEKKPLPAIT